jgi:methionyl aminopeptidase
MNTLKQKLMLEGGARLGKIKRQLVEAVRPGVTPLEIDALADNLITSCGDYPSFKTVRGYHHATCINTNDAVVHGIPNAIPFKAGDLVTIDIGLVHKGWHLDTSITTHLPPIKPEVEKFLRVGQEALESALKQALPGHSIYEISLAMQTVVEAAGFNVIRDLTGHGVGKHLHEEPNIPCYADSRSKNIILKPGQSIAVEIMYTMGDYRLKTGPDGWTLYTIDGSLTGMFEESVFITETSQNILTK